jgi:acyl dehydratase
MNSDGTTAARRGEPFRVVVEEGKIHEFARATRSSLPEHLRAHDPVSPVTFLTSAQLWMRPENSAWRGVTRNFANILHGEQLFVFHAPPPAAGAELTALQYIGNVYEKAGRRGGRMIFTEVVTTFWHTSPAAPVAEATALSIETEPRFPSDSGSELAAAQESAAAAQESAAAAESAATAEPAAAPKPPPPTADYVRALDQVIDAPITITDFVKYQGASGDFNPIHHDTAFAEAAGFPGPFAVGMLPAGIAASYVTDRYGATSIRRFKVRWRNPAWPGDVLTYQGFVLRQGSSEYDLRMTVTRPNGEVHLEAWIELVPAVGPQLRNAGAG